MSLAEKLAANNVTAEDLEMAAAVHLFEKQAAAEQIDLSTLTQEEVETLFNAFVADITSDDAEPENKEASVDLFATFTKQAAAEKIDLASLPLEHQVELFNTWLAAQLEEETPSEDEVKEAEAKLAEAEVIGRHMANAFLSQVEEGQAKTASTAKGTGPSTKSPFVQHTINKVEGAAEKVKGAVRGAPAAFRGLSRGGKAGVVGGALAVGAGGAYAAKKMYDRKKQASSPLLDQVALIRARELLAANGIDPDTGKEAAASDTFEDAVNARAAEMLIEAGYQFEE